MKIEEGKFYFIKDSYFDLFKDYKLMQNKENGTKRPCYLCFKDTNNEKIIWFVPISHKVEKYKKIYNEKFKRRKKVYNFVFGKVLGEEKVFLIQNMFPVTNKYIISKYQVKGKDVNINFELKNKVIETANKALDLFTKYNGIILFNDVYKMIGILEKEEVYA